jgi:hypothetical protein
MSRTTYNPPSTPPSCPFFGDFLGESETLFEGDRGKLKRDSILTEDCGERRGDCSRMGSVREYAHA